MINSINGPKSNLKNISLHYTPTQVTVNRAPKLATLDANFGALFTRTLLIHRSCDTIELCLGVFCGNYARIRSVMNKKGQNL